MTEELSLDALSARHEALSAFVAGNRPLAIVIFTLAYIGVTALSLPGATVMSLLGGLLFGPALGTALVVISATIGAAVIFQAARTAVGDTLRTRAGPFAARMEEGFAENAFSYLLLLRLIPVFPFFIVNIAPALFKVKLTTFLAATFIGIIPGAFAFVSAGNGLSAVMREGGEVELTGLLTQPDILTPIIALSALALVPIIAKALMKKKGATAA